MPAGAFFMAYLMSFPLTYVVAWWWRLSPLPSACRSPSLCAGSPPRCRSTPNQTAIWAHRPGVPGSISKEVRYVSSLLRQEPGEPGYIKNMEVVGFCDLNGVNAFQMALHKTETGAITCTAAPSAAPAGTWWT